MCGIVGFTGRRADREEILKAMMDAIAHRGPDGAGSYFGDGVALGHRRLSIIDIEGGRQPMFNEDKRLAVVFNGEIYNFMELRAQLQAAGHTFASDHSDTEVLLHGYEEWGEGMLEKLRGMFAFAIWDEADQSLFCARDPFGWSSTSPTSIPRGRTPFSRASKNCCPPTGCAGKRAKCPPAATGSPGSRRTTAPT